MAEYDVITTQETVDYGKYNTKYFKVRVKKDNIEDFKEKILGTSFGEQKELMMEFVQKKMHKMPKVVITGTEYIDSANALKDKIFGV